MSSINCSNCGSSNPTGSRFCNNCGTLLRAATKLICPSCKTPNPNHLMYCDHCGTRLVRDGAAKKAEKPAGAPPPSPNLKAFSLPARPSGKTADLDIDGEIPDWLKTGGSSDVPAGEPKENPPPVTPSRPTPPTAGEALPDWLNDLALPGTGPLPFRKTTDQLLSKQKGQVEADLPDWLTEWQIEEPETTPRAVDMDRSAPDWLTEYPTIQEERPSAVPKPTSPERPAKAVENEIPDWLVSPTPTPPPPAPPKSRAEAGDDEGIPDWLRSFDLTADPESDKPQAPAGKKPPDRLVSPPPAKVEPVDDEAMPDWLRSFDLPTGSAGSPPAGSRPIPPEPTAGTEDLPDWLSKATPASPPPPPSTPSQAQLLADDEAMPDWLPPFDQPESGQTSVPAGDDTLDWLIAPTSQPQPAVEEDWLSDFFTPPSQQTTPTTQDEPMPDWLADPDQAVTSWEQPTVQQTSASNDPSDWLTELESLSTPSPTSITPVQPSAAEEMPNWLSEMAPPTTGPLRPFEQSHAEGVEVFYTDFDDLPDWLKGPEAPPKEPPKGEPVVEEPEEFWAVSGSGGLPPESEFPDWLTAMESGQFEPESESATQLPPSSSDLPDWLSEVTDQPTFDLISSPTPETEKLSVDVSPTLPGSAELQGIPKQLAGESLPDWLNPNPLGGPLERPAETTEVPDWLRPAKPGAFDTLITPEEPAVLPTSGEWSGLLGELPPAAAVPVGLRKGDIPEWLEALKPSEEISGAVQKVEEPEQTTGPLAGMRGVIEIEPIIAKPVAAQPMSRPGISPEQEKQVTLLRQLTQGEVSRPVVVAQQTSSAIAPTPRLLLSLLLIGVILLGLLLPNVLPVPLPAGENVNQIQQTLATVAGQPVLVAFDYLPAFNGELGSQADLLLTQLATNNSPVIWASQTPAGLALGQQATASNAGQPLGLLPGEAAGLRKLAVCLLNTETCQINYDEQTRQSLSQVKLIILLTSERDSLVNWVEQVHTATNIPILAGVTQAMKPVAQPYLISGQLNGLLNGLPDGAQLEQAIGASQELQHQYQATSLAQLLAASLLIIGNLLYLLRGLRRSRRGISG